MKIIFSRKGFDSGFGNLPSPILPDGKMLSIPIPQENGTYKYSDLSYNGKTYLEIMNDLSGGKLPKKCQNLLCHIDPDIENRYIKSPENWKPAFGQKGAAAEHLKNKEYSVKLGDVFLFFGWFRKTEMVNGKYQYVKSAPDIHAIFGYMEVGEQINDNERIIKEYSYHPHAQYFDDLSNTLYIPRERASFFKDAPGYKMLNYSDKRRLTAIDVRYRGIWELPKFFRDINITYHNNQNTGFLDSTNYFYSASRGQEFVCQCDGNKEIEDWLKDILTD